MSESPQEENAGPEAISEPITDIEQAITQIIGGARQVLLGLAWEDVGLPPSKIEELLDGNLAEVILGRAPLRAGLTCANTEREHDHNTVEDIPSSQRKQLTKSIWLVMASPEISPQEATFLRDYIVLQSVEAVAFSCKADAVFVIEHFAQNQQGPYYQAALNVAFGLIAHPEVHNPEEE